MLCQLNIKGTTIEDLSIAGESFDFAKLNFDVYTKLDEVPHLIWNSLALKKTTLHTNYLSVLESIKLEGIQNIYVVYNYNNQPIGITFFQKLFFTGAALKPYLPQSNNFIQKQFFSLVAKTMSIFKGHVLVAGNLLITADNGFNFNQNFSPQIISNLLKVAGDHIISIAKTHKIQLSILTDFAEVYAGKVISKNLCNICDYKMFEADPNLVMDISRWTSFEAYLQDLTSKYRGRLKKIIKDSSQIERFEIDLNNFDQYCDDIDSLYKNVIDKIPFKMVEVNATYFKLLLQRLNGDFKIYGYLLNDKLVGFITAFAENEIYDVHLIGLDYNVNPSYKLYNKILYDMIELGIEGNFKTISFGRTANEIKSTLGAAPERMICYMKHRNFFLNQVVGVMLKIFKPKPWQQRHPFKVEK